MLSSVFAIEYPPAFVIMVVIVEARFMDINEIQRLCKYNLLRWTNHVLVRLIQRGISREDVKCALMNGEIIEQYPDDYPYSSCLILGLSVNKKHIHIVCGVGDDELWLITVYYPNPLEWTDDFRVRKE